MAITGASTSSSATSFSEFVASILRVIETMIRQICHQLSEYGISALLKTVVLFVVLFAVKENLKYAFGYDCPEENHYFYASVYIFGPAVFFLCFAFIFSRPFWEFVMGCCRLSCHKRLLASPRSAVDIYLAISAPFLWAACAFTEVDYYVCALYGPTSYEDQQKDWSNDPSTKWRRNAKSRSHIIAWMIILCWALISAVVVSLHRCCFRNGDTKSKGGYVTV